MSSPQPVFRFAASSASPSASARGRDQQPALTLFAIGLMGMGVIALVVGDFAMVWQPVASWIPGRSALAYAAGLLELTVGCGLLFERTRTWAVRILFPGLILWASLKLPAVLVAPKMEAVWLGLGELTLLLSGGWTLFAQLADLPRGSVFAFAAGERGLRAARMLFACHSESCSRVAPISRGLGPAYRRRSDCERSGSALRGVAAPGCLGRSGADIHLHPAHLASRLHDGFCRKPAGCLWPIRQEIAVYCFLYLLDRRCRCVDRHPEYFSEVRPDGRKMSAGNHRRSRAATFLTSGNRAHGFLMHFAPFAVFS
jgi:hypothetical protein